MVAKMMSVKITAFGLWLKILRPFFKIQPFFKYIFLSVLLSVFECSQSGGLPGAGAAMFHSLICLSVVEAELQLCTSY